MGCQQSRPTALHDDQSLASYPKPIIQISLSQNDITEASTGGETTEPENLSRPPKKTIPVLSPVSQVSDESQSFKNKSSNFADTSLSARANTRAFDRRMTRAKSLRLSMSSPKTDSGAANSHHQQLNIVKRESLELKQKFNETYQQSAVWHQQEWNQPILAVSFSSIPSSLSLAISTGTNVHIQEIIDDDILRQSVGTTMVLPVPRVRAVAASTACWAVGGDAGVCHVWNRALMQPMYQISRVDRITCLQYSPDGQYLMIGGYDGTLAICREQSIVAEVPLDGLVLSLDWSPNGSYISILGSDKSLVIVETTEWNIVRKIGVNAQATCMKWHPAGKYIAIGGYNIQLFDVLDFSLVHEITHGDSKGFSPTRAGRITALTWSPNQGRYLVACYHHECVMYESISYTEIHRFSRQSSITGVAWGEKQADAGIMARRYLAVASEDGVLAILKAGANSSPTNMDGMSSVASSYFSRKDESAWKLDETAFVDVDDDLLPTSEGIEGDMTVRCMRFSKGPRSHGSTYIAVATANGVLTLRSPKQDWSPLCQFHASIRSMCFSNGSRYLALATELSTVKVITTVPKWSVLTEFVLESQVTAICFSHSDERLAVACRDGTISFVSPLDDWTIVGEATVDGSVSSLDWTSECLAVGTSSGVVNLYASCDCLNGKYDPIHTIWCPSSITSLSLGGNSRFLAVGMADGSLQIYTTKTQLVMCHEDRLSSVVSTIEWCPKCRYVAICGQDGLFRVLDSIFWAPIYSSEGLGSVNESSACLSVSQDGKLIAVSTKTKGIMVMNSNTWEVVLDESMVADREENQLEKVTVLSAEVESVDQSR